ncbi:MAG UNVERIFIED_CONTAM: hypothetical protein LVR18_35575 [Planctomycetaceae bacterium]
MDWSAVGRSRENRQTGALIPHSGVGQRLVVADADANRIGRHQLQIALLSPGLVQLRNISSAVDLRIHSDHPLEAGKTLQRAGSQSPLPLLRRDCCLSRSHVNLRTSTLTLKACRWLRGLPATGLSFQKRLPSHRRR